MLPQGIASPEQLTVLTHAVRDYCVIAHIGRGTKAYDDVGRQVMNLFECGISGHNDLMKALRANNRVGR
jgi:hypothetical protein